MSLVGGEFQRFDVTLQVVGHSVVPAEVSALFGIEATFASAKGEVRRTKAGRELIQPTGVWTLRCSGAAGLDVAEAVDSFLVRLPLEPVVWKEVVRMGSVCLCLTVWFSEENGSARLPARLLSKLSTLGVDLLVDVWAESENPSE